MILERTMHPSWLSNSYLVADRPGGCAVLVDSGGPAEPHVERIEALGLSLRYVLCTHHHVDHVAHNDLYRRRFGAQVCGHASERDLFDRLDATLEHDELLRVGELEIRALHIPGHTRGQLAFLIDASDVFTGDTLFRRSVGGTRGPGHTTYVDLRSSILDVLMALPDATRVHPGHTEPTTIREEWEQNPFIRLWRGLDEPGDADCTALGEPATLLLEARDYDGGTKCCVRFADGTVDSVPGSRVERR